MPNTFTCITSPRLRTCTQTDTCLLTSWRYLSN